jgi:integrase/recombinase XerD
MTQLSIKPHMTSFSNGFEPQAVADGHGFRARRADRERMRVLERGVLRLCSGDLPGKEHTDRYLHHKYRLHLSAGTIRSSISVLEAFLVFLKTVGRRHLEQMSRADLEGFIEHEQERGLKSSTVSSKLKVLKAFVRFLMEHGVVNADVLSKRLTVKVAEGLPRAIPPEDIRRLLSIIEDVQDRAMVMVLLRTGMRIGELLDTQINDVLIEQSKILIYEAHKDHAGRVVYLSDDALRALKAWLEKRDPQKDCVFYAQGHRCMSYSCARTMFYQYLLRAGLSHKGYSLHCLRHTFATELLNAGMSLECLQLLLGHATLQMTLRYAKLSDNTREEQYFRAMAVIEKEHTDGHHQLDGELQALFEETQLLGPHGEDLPQHP